MSKIQTPSISWQPELPNAQLRYFQNFLSVEAANYYYKVFLKNIPWQQDNVKVYGKTYAQPRLTSLHSNTFETYTYSGLTLKPHIMIPELLELLNQIKVVSNHEYNSVLLNLYRDGADSNGWHADNEKELGKHPQIASFSLGASRFFHFKHRRIRKEKYKMELHHGSLLLMEGAMQKNWLHQIPKTKKPLQPRINLTFRKII